VRRGAALCACHPLLAEVVADIRREGRVFDAVFRMSARAFLRDTDDRAESLAGLPTGPDVDLSVIGSSMSIAFAAICCQ